MENKNLIIAIAIVVLIMLLVAVNGHRRSDSVDRAIREAILEGDGGYTDCTGSNSQSFKCQYLMNL